MEGPADAGEETVLRTRHALARALADRSHDLQLAGDLLHCVQSSTAAEHAFQFDVDDVLQMALAALTNALQGQLAEASGSVLQFLNATATELYELGEPAHDTVARLLTPGFVLDDGVLSQIVPVPIGYAVEQWWTPVENGTLTLTTTAPNGAETKEVLVSFDGPTAGNVVLTPQQGHSYLLNLTAYEQGGRVVTDSFRFRVDALPPLLESAPSALAAFSGSLNLAYVTKDLDSAHSASLVRSADGGPWTTVASGSKPKGEPLTVSYVPSPSELLQLHGKLVRVRLAASDGVGNRFGASHFGFNQSAEGFATRVDHPFVNIQWAQTPGRLHYDVDPSSSVGAAEAFSRALPATVTSGTSFTMSVRWHRAACGENGATAYPVVLDSPNSGQTLWISARGPCSSNVWVQYKGADNTIRSMGNFAAPAGGTYLIKFTYDASLRKMSWSAANEVSGAPIASNFLNLPSSPATHFSFSRLNVMGGPNGPDGFTSGCNGCAHALGWVDDIRFERPAEVWTRVDAIAPTVVVNLLDVEGLLGQLVVTKPRLRASFSASESLSGLGSVTVTLRNLTTDQATTWYSASNLNGAASHTASLPTIIPALDSRYRVEVVATDRAGNQNVAYSSEAVVHVRPSVKLNVPRVLWQTGVYVPINATAHVPHYLAELNETRLVVLNPSGVEVVNQTFDGEADYDDFSYAWNGESAATGNWTVRAWAARWGIVNQTEAKVRVMPFSNGGRNPPFSVHYDRVTSSNDVDMFRYRIPLCHTGYKVTVTPLDAGPTPILYRRSFGGGGLDFQLDASDTLWTPIPNGHEEGNFLEGDTIGFKVERNAGDVAYELEVLPRDVVCVIN